MTNDDVEETTASVPDTLVTFPDIAVYDLITTSVAHNSNPGITGRISRWEKRYERMFTDSTHRVIKTLIMDESFQASESPLPLYNEDGPIFLDLSKSYSRFGIADYWNDHILDNENVILFKDHPFFDLNDCRFGEHQWKSILSTSHPIAVHDGISIIPIIYYRDNSGIHAVLMECVFRSKCFLVSTFDFDELENTTEGRYFKQILINYTYSDYFRHLNQNITMREISYESWHSTFIPGW